MIKYPDTAILLVDDEAVNLRTFIRVFRKLFTISPASSADEALHLVQSTLFTVAFIDYRMAGTNGVALARHLKVTHPKLPCILLTGCPDPREVQSAIQEGLCSEVIGKPWDRTTIEACVKRHAG